MSLERMESRCLLAGDLLSATDWPAVSPQAEGESQPLVSIRLEVADAAGDPVAEVTPGESFELRAYVRDLSQTPQGVFAAFADVSYDAQTVALAGPVEFSPLFGNFPQGDVGTAGLLDEVGAVGDSTPLTAPGEYLLLTAPFEALQPGSTRFEVDPADVLPKHGVLLHGVDDAVPPSRIDFQGVSIEVIGDPQLPLAELTLVATDLDDRLIDQVAVGETFLLHAYARDTSDDPHGVFAAYLDVAYPAEHVTTAGSLTFGPSYPNSQRGDNSLAGWIDEAGGTAGFSELGPAPLLLWTQPFRAEQAGSVVFRGDPADDRPRHDVLVYRNDASLAVAQVELGSASVQVVAAAAADDVVSVQEDSVDNVVAVLANDTFADGAAPAIVALDAAAVRGTLSIADGAAHVVYTPPADFFGDETFRYTVDDGLGGTHQAEATVQVRGVNDDPLARDDALVVHRATAPILLEVLANDSVGPDHGETLGVASVGPSAAGATVESTDGGKSLAYAPPEGFFGLDTFSYVVHDGNGGTARATVTIEVFAGWQHPVEPLNVNDDQAVSPLDALLVINELNRAGSYRLGEMPEAPRTVRTFLDSSGDGWVSAIDALLVINELNARTAAARTESAEGEPVIPRVTQREPLATTVNNTTAAPNAAAASPSTEMPRANQPPATTPVGFDLHCHYVKRATTNSPAPSDATQLLDALLSWPSSI